MQSAIIFVSSALALAACSSKDSTPTSTPTSTATRTLVTRPLTLGSPQNLLLNPFVGGELKTGWGHFRAGYDTGASATMQRTFLSASPVGGAVSIETVPAGSVPSGASTVTVTAPFLGGPGTFHADVWLSAASASGAALPIASVASAVTIAVTSPDTTTSTTLVASARDVRRP